MLESNIVEAASHQKSPTAGPEEGLLRHGHPKAQHPLQVQRLPSGRKSLLLRPKVTPSYRQVGGSGSITATPKPTVKPKPSKPVKPTCEDGNKHCAYWAGEDECKKNPEWSVNLLSPASGRLKLATGKSGKLNLPCAGCWSAALSPATSARTSVMITTCTARWSL